MSRYLISASYTAEGAKGLARSGGTSRRKAIDALVAGVNGTVESMYFAMGTTDVVVIVDVPDLTSVMALSLAVNSSGAVRLTTTPLMSVEEMDAASKMTVAYQAPGQ